MPISLPIDPAYPPAVRVLVKQKFVSAAFPHRNRSTGAWTVYNEATAITAGIELLMVKRCALPEIGTAEFRWVYGKFGVAGDLATLPPNIIKYEVRIQIQPHGGTTTDWTTVFWGHIDDQTDIIYPGTTSYSQGVRIYRAVDGFARATKWMLDYTGFAGDTVYKVGPVRGHPGYNYTLTGDGILLGNKAVGATYLRQDVPVICHAFQGAFALTATSPNQQTTNKWYESEMIDHACASVRPDDEPLFALDGFGYLNYNSVTPQSVYANESVWDFVARLTNRRRGNAVNFIDWVDEPGNPDGYIEVFITSNPLIYELINYTVPGGGAASIVGAFDAGTAYLFDGSPLLDLEGDNRNLDEDFKFSDSETNVHDYVRTVGEPIEVAATLCMYDGAQDSETNIYDPLIPYSLTPRWSAADVTTFAALPQVNRTMNYWNHVFQAFGLPQRWNCQVGTGFNTDSERIDYKFMDDGNLFVPSETDDIDTSANLVEILGYLPFFDGYKYADVSYPQKTDNATQFGYPSRRPAFAMIRPAGWNLDSSNGHYVYTSADNVDRWLLPMGQLPAVVTTEKAMPQSIPEFQPALTIHPDAILCLSQNQIDQGVRLIADPIADAARTGDNKDGATMPVTRLAFTVGLRLPHRVSFVYADPAIPVANGMADWTKARRRRTIYIENVHFWLAPSVCTYDLKQDDPNKFGYVPQRNALGSTIGVPAILRDDRPYLMRYHLLAVEWYTKPRRRIQFGMQYCGLLPFTYLAPAATQASHPTLGQYIFQLRANGSIYDVGTVITAIRYDHRQNTTHWETDYFDLETK